MSSFQEDTNKEWESIDKIKQLRADVITAIDKAYGLLDLDKSSKSYELCHKEIQKLPCQACYCSETQELIYKIKREYEIKELEERLSLLKRLSKDDE